MTTFVQDIRYALRTLVKSPGFTIVAVLTIALGIGANTAIFSIVNALMLRTLPVEDPGKLDVIGRADAPGWLSMGSPRVEIFSVPLYHEIARTTEAYSSIAAVGRIRGGEVSMPATDGTSQTQEKARGRLVTGNYFAVLGLRPILGRTFTAEEDSSAGAAPVTVISYNYWTRRFNREANAIGKTLKVNGYPLTIIGVLPEGYYGDVVGEEQDYYVPIMMQSSVMPGHDYLNDENTSWLLLIGRRKPGLTLDQARESTKLQIQNIVASTWATSKFGEEDRKGLLQTGIEVTEGGKGISALRKQFRKPLVLLSIIVGLVLLIACVNVANLTLARSSTRQTEMAVRVALGASAGRIVRQLITESVVLALVGGAVGAVLAKWFATGLISIASGPARASGLDLSLDWTVLAATFAISVFTGVLFGLAPALRARSVDLTPALKANARSALSSAGRPSLAKLLVAVQLVVSVSVLFAALLLVRSLQHLQQLDTGFNRDNLVNFSLDLLPAGYKDMPSGIAVANTLLERIRTIPGVRAASYSENGLFSGTNSAESILVDGRKPDGTDDDRVSSSDAVGPNFITTIGLPLVAGRDIGQQDTATSSRVVVVNEAFAKYYLAGQNPIGHTIAIDDAKQKNKPYEIVGVVRDARDHDVREKPERRFYQPFTQYESANGSLKFEVRYTGDMASVTQAVRRVFNDVNPAIRVSDVNAVNTLLREQMSDEVAIVRMTGLFAVLALTLACIGLYGVISYSVAGRTREIGVRIALGANRVDVLWLVLRDALIMIGTGIGIGVPVSALAARAMQSMIYGVSSLDPLAVLATVALLGAVGILAAYLPARRATRVDPMVALRYE